MAATPLPKRPAARLLVIDPDDRLLMFRFTPQDRPPFWCTPGGAVDPGESFEQAAVRELFEETGMTCAIGPEIARLHSIFVTLEGVEVEAEERFYTVRTDDCMVRVEGHTLLEQQVMQSHHWWTPHELAAFDERFYPDTLIDLWQSQVEGTR